MIKQIDDASYNVGYKKFRKGVTLKDMVNKVLAGPQEPEAKYGTPEFEAARDKAKAEERAIISEVVGFADAFLDHIRKR